ncbi:MAG: hypothetical protein AAF364_19320 [Pseudomonadota bacterium]
MIAGFFLIILLGMFTNPFSVNDSGYRTHVQQVTGKEFITFTPGIFYAGFWSKTTEYSDVVTVQFEREENKKNDISYFAPPTKCQFADGTYAEHVGFTVKWKLPNDEKAMLNIHKDYRGGKRLAESLADYSKECAQYSFQLMDSERHYSGGKSELRDAFQYQLRNGQYIVDSKEVIRIDSLTGESKRFYENKIRMNDKGKPILSLSDVQT